MKRLFLLAFAVVFAAGCYNLTSSGGQSAGNVKDKTFAQQYAELEKQPAQPTDLSPRESLALLSAAERQREVEIESQRERRAAPPLKESDYLFNLLPEKNVYSYDEYNQVWTDAPKERNYKETKRLWTKPKRHAGEISAAPQESGGESTEEYDPMEE
ncbi:MAG: hypothetical protein LBR90_03630 [Elusimicrobiota bacterium]|jgi:hypothetical protein|nr:hypothetical protein [Elusimicrobiota bacterium]